MTSLSSARAVPRGWRTVELDRISASVPCALAGGPFGSSLTTRDYVDAGVPVIRGSNMGGDDCRFLDSGFVFVSAEKAEELRRNTARPGDLVFTQRGTLGQVAIIPEDARFDVYVVSQSQMKLTVDPEAVDRRYVYWYFRSRIARSLLQSRIQATGVPHINLGVLRSFPILLPPLAEQRRIADILDRADDLRRKRRETIRLTDELIRATFLDMFGDLGVSVTRWPAVRLGAVIESAQYGTAERSNTDGRGIPILRMNNITACGEWDLSDLKWAELSDSELEANTVRPGDLLFNRTNSPELVGKTAVWRQEDKFAFAGYLIRVRFDETKILPEFVAGYLNSPGGKRYLFERAKPSNNMSNFSASMLADTPVPLPPLASQSRYVRSLAAMRAQASRLTSLATGANRLCESVLHRAFSGTL